MTCQVIMVVHADILGVPLDLSIIRETEQSQLAILSQAQDQCLLTLMSLPDLLLNNGNFQSN